VAKITAASVKTASNTAPSRMRRLSFTHPHQYCYLLCQHVGFHESQISYFASVLDC
jgi:hypothetical protein